MLTFCFFGDHEIPRLVNYTFLGDNENTLRYVYAKLEQN